MYIYIILIYIYMLCKTMRSEGLWENLSSTHHDSSAISSQGGHEELGKDWLPVGNHHLLLPTWLVRQGTGWGGGETKGMKGQLLATVSYSSVYICEIICKFLLLSV